MKIIFTGLTYNGYDPARGKSFEHATFLKSLAQFPGAEVSYVPFDQIPKTGKAAFNQELLRKVRQEKPDLLFAFMYSDEFDPAALAELKKHTATLAWFADDSWRFWNYSRNWAPHFTWAVTTYSWMPPLYRKYGQPNVIRSQWAADPGAFRPSPLPSGFERPPQVSFVGGKSRPRAEILRKLQEAGIKAEVFGSGWRNTRRLSDDEMIGIFAQSKINLGLNPAPGYWNMNSLGRLVLRPHLNRIVPDFHPVANLQSWLTRGIPQVKARHFEIPACGGFLLTGEADDLRAYYEPDKEIVLYRDSNDLIQKVRYYLAHETERAEIARRGYERTIRDHTYAQRFREIFARIGLL